MMHIYRSLSRIMFLAVLLSGHAAVFSQVPNEILGRPTDHSITVSVLFDQAVSLYIEYGTTPGIYPFTTPQISNIAGTPDEIVMTGLTPGTVYYYRTRFRTAGAGSFSAGQQRKFRTQRAAGSAFTFTLESDEHMYDKKGVKNLYQICLNNQAADDPDFMFSLGDNFGDDHHPGTITSADMAALHKNYRPYFGSVCHSIPLFICLGNHEGENDYFLGMTPPENLAVYATLWRKFYYPNPFPDGFYTGNMEEEPYGIGKPENYYAWTWGDALFVVLDAYRYQCDTSAKPKNWDWTLGTTQYQWFKNTLEQSSSAFKFVFIHQLRGQGRGGVADAKYFEWGGYEGNGTVWGFDTNRPGWDKPIHQLMVDNHVNILFHGHDHLFAHEVLDGLVYQELPMPSDSTYEIGMLANADAYLTDKFDGSGHVRVKVTPECVKVDFVRAYLSADTITGLHHNREVAFSYTLGTCSMGAGEVGADQPDVRVFPVPASDVLNVTIPNEASKYSLELIDAFGQKRVETTNDAIDVRDFSDGMYLLKVKTAKFSFIKKILIAR